MKVRFQYVDFTTWEGDPADAATSPDLGVVRMYAIDDFDREVIFVYDDFYFLYPADDDTGAWIFGSGTPKREYRLTPGVDGALAELQEFNLPQGAVVRLGQTVSHEDAVAFGLTDTDGKILHEKQDVNITIGG